MNDWKEYKLGEIINVINGFAFKSESFLESSVDNFLPIIKIKNVANGDVHLNDVQFYLYSEELSRYVIGKGDVLLSLTGNHSEVQTQVVGLVSKYKLDCKAFLNQRVAKIISKNDEKLSNDYIYYFLKDTNTHQYLANQSSGSANQANISKSDIENISISLPPFSEQTVISSILSSLDNKINLLHRQNKTLEQLAETLFRQWFVEEAVESREGKSLVDEDSKVSFITKIELLAWNPPIPEDIKIRVEFLAGSEIHYINEEIIERATRIRKETNIKLPDAVIAATALTYDFILLSDNDKDFIKVEPLGLKYMNPKTAFTN